MAERSAGAGDSAHGDLGVGPHSLSAKDLLTRAPADAKKMVVDNYRQAIPDDAEAVQGMLTPFTSSLFGNTNPAIIIERSTFCLSCLSEEKEVVAFGAFCPYPMQPRVCRRIPRDEWQSWMRRHYDDVEYLTPIDTLFCHLLVAKKGFQLGLFTEVIDAMFIQMPDVDQIFFTIPPEADVGVALKKLCKGDALQRKESSLRNEIIETDLHRFPLPAYPTVLRCLRHDHVPTLHLRPAVQRDSDDITALFTPQEQAPLQEQYGEYFVAEIIKMGCDDIVSLVAEHYGKVVGFVTVTKRVDVESLRHNYQLEIYNNLKARPKPAAAPSDTDESVRSSDTISANGSSATSGIPDVMVSAPSPGPNDTEQKSASNMSSSKLAEKESAATAGKDGTTSSATLKSSLKSSPTSGSKLADVTSQKLSSASGVGKSQTKIGSASRVTFQDVKPVAEEMTSSAVSVAAAETGGATSLTSSSVDSTGESAGEALTSPSGSETSSLPEMLKRDMEYDGPLTESIVIAEEEVPNVVCLRLFCMDPEHESRYIDFIRRLFQIFDDIEYCVVTQVTTTKESPLYKLFTRAERVIGSNLNSDLYLIHRNALLDDYEVGYVKDDECEEIEDFVGELSDATAKTILTDISWYLDNGCEPEEYGGALMHVVRVKCHGEVVAVAVLRDVQDPDWLRAHYDTESMINWQVLQQEDHKYLNHFVINPGFLSRQRFILGQVMHAAKATNLFYELYEGRNHATEVQRQRAFTLTPALDLMTLATARRQIVYMKDWEIKPSARVLKKKDPVTMFHVNRKFLVAIRDVINTRVVVVGASDAGLAALDILATNPYLRFNNLVLIDPQGIPGMSTPAYSGVDDALPHTLWGAPAVICQSGLSAWVTVVRAKMSSLNRTRQEVILDNRCRVPYDELVICTGTQFSAVRSVLAAYKKVAGLELKELEAKVEPNVVSINTVQDAEKAVALAREQLTRTRGRALVCGSTVSAYTAIHMLLSNGIAAGRIDLVLPTPPGSSQGGECFPDECVAQQVSSALQNLGVTLRYGEVLQEWESEEGAVLPQLWVTFTNIKTGAKGQEPADALFYFDKKTVDQDAFLAMNSSRLVFDSRLVIDEHFTTTDPLIRAAGPCTKYQLKLYRDGWKPERYSSREIGSHVANLLMDKYDPRAVEVKAEVTTGHTPWFEDRLSVRASLPGGHTYIRIASPPRMTDSSTSEPGFQDKIISTNTDEGYLSFKFVRGKIATITLLTKQDVEIDNITSLWGYHSHAFRRLLDENETQPIENLFRFLRQEWLSIYFYDHYPDALQEMRLVLDCPVVEENSEESMSLREFAEDLLKVTHGQLDKSDMGAMAKRYETTNVVSGMQRMLLDFICKHRDQLPMYALPHML